MSEKKDKVVFFVTIPPAEEDRMQVALGFASIAASLGYDVTVYLTFHSVLMVKKSVYEKLDKRTKDMIQNAIKSNVKILACRAAMSTFNVKEEELIEGVGVIGPVDFFDIAKGSMLLTF